MPNFDDKRCPELIKMHVVNSSDPQHILNMKISKLIGNELYVANQNDNCDTLAERFRALNVHALVVVDSDEKPVGFVSSTDLTPDISATTTVSEIMNDQVYSIEIDREPRQAARMMRDLGVHHLVVTEDDTAVGMLSSFDLMRVIEESD